ncbi:NERD domain-containing protein [Streptomyces collinus]
MNTTFLIVVVGAVAWFLWDQRRRRPPTGAGASADRHARALRTPLVRLADALGIETAAGARAGRFAVAAAAEARIGALLDQLQADGFAVLHDRDLHGKNIDHLLIGPRGDVTVGDTKAYTARYPLTVRDGRLYRGRRDITGWLDGLQWEAREVSRRLGNVPVRKLVIVEGAALLDADGRPVTELRLGGIRIVPAARAVETLRRTARIPGQRSRTELTALAEHALPPHTGR